MSTDERIALEQVLTDLFRDAGAIRVIASEAGLEESDIAFGLTTSEAWHGVLNAAIAAERMNALEERTRRRFPRSQRLEVAWQAYFGPDAAALGGDAPVPIAEMGVGVEVQSQRADERRDARIDQMQRDLADMRVQVAGLVAQVTALTEMVRTQNNERGQSSLSSTQFGVLLVAFGAIAILVFALVYYGGNR